MPAHEFFRIEYVAALAITYAAVLASAASLAAGFRFIARRAAPEPEPSRGGPDPSNFTR